MCLERRASSKQSFSLHPTVPTITITMKVGILMSDERYNLTPLALLRLQGWLSPAFPSGSYSYSHSLEWAIEAGYVDDHETLIDWLEADLRYGSGRNEAIFFIEAWRPAPNHD